MDPVDVAFAGIALQADLVRTRVISARELVAISLDRIERLNPRLNATASFWPERALAEAEEADRRVMRGEAAPLMGVPMLVKDDTDVAGEVTGFGSAAFTTPAAGDAEVVRRLRRAGAIVVGKTTLPELAIRGVTESAAHGTTRNPWSLGYTPGGSSGGSAVAVAAGLVGAATGSDGAGSIRIPAAFTGVFGLKPQYGRVPAPAHWHGLAAAGCLTRTVVDTALFLDVTLERLAGPPPPPRPYVEHIRSPVGRLRIGVATTPFRTSLPAPLHPQVQRSLLETAALLGDLGHQVREVALRFGTSPQAFSARYLRGIHDHATSAPSRAGLERRTRRVSRLGALVPPAIARAARRAAWRDGEQISAVFQEVDVLLTPVSSSPPFPIGRWDGDGALRLLLGMGRTFCFTPPWNHTGHPAASIPAGFTEHGLPLAVQIVGRTADEATLLALAAQLEAARPWAHRRPPLTESAAPISTPVGE